MNTEQSGIWKIVLYENIDITVIRDVTGEIQSILNAGQVLEILECNEMFFNYVDSQIIGENDTLMHSFKISFNIFGLNQWDFLEKLSSLHGYIPVVFFRSGTIGAILSPIFFNDTEYLESNTQFYPLVMSSEIPTFEGLQIFADEPVVWILENGIWGGADTTWTADGTWKTI